MTLQEMVYAIDGTAGNRYQSSQMEILQKLDIAQKIAFNHDCRAFEKTAALPPTIEEKLNIIGTIPETKAEVEAAFTNYNPGIGGNNPILYNWAIAFAGDASSINVETALQTSDGFLYRAVVVSQYGRNWLRIVPNPNLFKFPADCRIIKEVFARGIVIDPFTRTITSNVPRDALTISYYRQPETLTSSGVGTGGFLAFSDTDEAKVIIPNEWQWQVLIQPAIALLDSQLYGEKSPQAVVEGYLKEFWTAMNARRNDGRTLVSIGAF